jgi:hypothetical protein
MSSSANDESMMEEDSQPILNTLEPPLVDPPTQIQSQEDEQVAEESSAEPTDIVMDEPLQEKSESASAIPVRRDAEKEPPHSNRLDEDFVRKELSLADLVMLMDDYKPLVRPYPNWIIKLAYMAREVLQCCH